MQHDLSERLRIFFGDQLSIALTQHLIFGKFLFYADSILLCHHSNNTCALFIGHFLKFLTPVVGKFSITLTLLFGVTAVKEYLFRFYSLFFEEPISEIVRVTTFKIVVPDHFQLAC